MKKIITLIALVFDLGLNAQTSCFMETSQADFQADVSSNTNLNTSPGDVLLNLVSVDQQNTTLGTSGVGITTTTWGGQTFTPAVTGTLDKIDINLFCSGCTGTTPTLSVEIRATSGGLPTGAAISTGSITGFNSGSSAYYTSVFSTPATLTAGTQYAIVIHPTANPSPGTYALTRSGTSTAGSDVYAGGTRVTGATSGTVWSIPLTGGVSTDGGFRTYMTANNISGTITSQTKDAGMPVTWASLSYTAITPANTAIQFQIAGSNNPTGPFNFVGPDGTSSTYFTSSGASLSQFTGVRYLQYEAFLTTTDGINGTTPTLSDVTLCYNTCVPPSITIAGDTIISAGGSTTLTASGASTYTWNTGSNNSFIVVSPTVNTTYTVIGTNTVGCTDTAQVSVYLNGAALNFDGVDDYVDAGSLNFASYTKEAWVYTPDASGANNIISSNNAPFWLNGGNFAASNDFTITGTIVSDPNPFPTDVWTHIAVTYDAASTTMTLYKNGVQVAQNTSIPPYIVEDITIGQYGGGNNFIGTMDEVRIWNYARTACQINSGMNCELPAADRAGLVAYYQFNQGVSNIANSTVTVGADSSGNNNNGTLQNFALNGTTSNWVAPGAITPGVSCGLIIGNVAINANMDTTILMGGTATLTASGAPSYTWSTGSNMASVTVSPTLTTNYTVTGSDGTCSRTDTISVLIGTPGAALSFDGVDDAITIADNSSLDISQQITLEAWVYATNGSGTQDVICKSSCTGSNDAYIFPRTDDGWNNFVAYFNIGGGWQTLSAPYAGLNQWHHLAATYDGSYIRLYQDGILAATSSFIGGSIAINSNPLSFGTQPGCGEYFGGSLDEARVWNRALCQTEIQNNMNGELKMPQNGLMAYYKFNEGIAGTNNFAITTAIDSSGNSNDGILTNFALTGNTSNWIMPGAVNTGSYAPMYVAPTLTVMGSTTICAGATTTLTASGAVTYTWTTGSMNDTTLVSPSANASYSVVGIDGAGCASNTAITTVAVNPLPTIMAMVNTPTVCTGATDTLNATGGVTYVWSSNAGSAATASVSITALASDTYTVTGNDANGCVNTNTVMVDVQTCTTGLEQVAGNSKQVSVYPNPSTGSFVVESDKELGVIELYDMLGNKVYSYASKQTQEQIDISALANGMYNLKVNGNSIRLVKTN